ncbi:MAG: YjbQ family protein [Rhodospirillales bacterium]|nr:YjbQ family protein [Rhodospirillales bacterium]
MRQLQDILTIRTNGQGNHSVTAEISEWLVSNKARQGLLTLFLQHVSASMTIRENPDRDDLHTFFRRLEGDDEMMSLQNPPTLRHVQISLPVRDGRMMLGARQGLYIYEHRETPHRRQLVLHYMGE